MDKENISTHQRIKQIPLSDDDITTAQGSITVPIQVLGDDEGRVTAVENMKCGSDITEKALSREIGNIIPLTDGELSSLSATSHICIIMIIIFMARKAIPIIAFHGVESIYIYIFLCHLCDYALYT